MKNLYQALELMYADYDGDDNNLVEAKDTLEKAIKCLEIMKPLLETIAPFTTERRFLAVVGGSVIYEFKNEQEYNLFKEWLGKPKSLWK